MTEAGKKSHSERAAGRRLWSPPDADGTMQFWTMQQLWETVAKLPVKKLRVADLAGQLDEVRWFSDARQKFPTCRAVAEHARDIFAVEFTHPIILDPQGEVIDGMHRLCKAWLLGREEIDAVQLNAMPAPAGRELPAAGKTK
jgi:hypothetical protein